MDADEVVERVEAELNAIGGELGPYTVGRAHC